MLTELLCPILGDALYMQRIVDISGVPNLIQPSQLYRAKKHPVPDAYSKLPLFWHVCRSIFPRYEYSQANNDRVDLVANAPLPSHMLAMLECLGMSDAAVKYLNAIAEEDDSERRFSGEQKF
ncbi:unnamed protein product [Anisakis simplex]|uniref:SOCS box domain-containing protein n=1 Tax=Anisakis simplex TaxID=6269 RepID=A0A0M3K9J7_ANISI|nr:unnamed protein product [Anisakis simplex]